MGSCDTLGQMELREHVPPDTRAKAKAGVDRPPRVRPADRQIRNRRLRRGDAKNATVA
jgi:hypothetical protein